MGLRLYRRKSLGHGLWAGASKSGLALAVLTKWEQRYLKNLEEAEDEAMTFGEWVESL
jgi:hypothetical protein